MKDPASHIGDRIIIDGQVTQFDSATGVGILSMQSSYGIFMR